MQTKDQNSMKKASTVRTKVVAGIVSLSVLLTTSTFVSYADFNISEALTTWFSKKTEIAISNLDQALLSETEKQKARLQEELRLRLEASSTELNQYTEDQKALYIQAIQQYADSLIASLSISNAEDEQQIRTKLDAILRSAQTAMAELADSYVPPALTLTPPAQPEQEADASSVELEPKSPAMDKPLEEPASVPDEATLPTTPEQIPPVDTDLTHPDEGSITDPVIATPDPLTPAEPEHGLVTYQQPTTLIPVTIAE